MVTEEDATGTATSTATATAAQDVDRKENENDDCNSHVTKKRKVESMSENDEQDKEGWRVKLYKLNIDGSWDDCGTGRIRILVENKYMNDRDRNRREVYQRQQEPMLHLQSENGHRVLLHTRILVRDAYQRQGDNIITWCEPFFGDRQTVDLALSFQDNAGCLDIWRQITNIQNNCVQDMAHAVAAAHHVELQRRQQQCMWEHVATEVHNLAAAAVHQDDDNDKTEQVAVSMAAAAAAAYAAPQVQPLPNPPLLENLEEIADIIAAGQQLQQRESLAFYMTRNDCAYLRALLQLFPSAESRGDYGALATLAACIKTILLMNEPSVMELILDETAMYEQVCAVLEYDPDLRKKANHRWFLATKVKFRTVVEMTNAELVSAIHKSFRVTYLRDTLLRPTMDESCLSTLSSLQSFTHSHVVKGVTRGGNDSYLCKIMTVLGKELSIIADMEWSALENPEKVIIEPASSETAEAQNETTCWKQHVAPQDGSLDSRFIRRKGALSFFRELFNMVRISLQQGDRDDFYAAICNMQVELDDSEKRETVNILSLLGNVLSDPSTCVSEKGGVLEIISGICLHDAGHIRRHGLDVYGAWKNEAGGEKISCPARPSANNVKQVIFFCGPNDLLASLLLLMAVETDAGLLLQTSEIMRIILDIDMLGEHGPMDTGPAGMQQHPNITEHSLAPHHSGSVGGSEQNHFLSMFYEHYVPWLVAPFQYTLLRPAKRLPNKALTSPDDSLLMKRILDTFRAGVSPKDPLLRIVPMCAIRSSFAVELLSFCVRAHLHRMKFFLLRSRVLGSVLRLLKPSKTVAVTSGDRCLKLAALRFLRSILSVKDEFYHRHIIQHNLFAPVFEAFRANPVGDNLVSSAIVEMCDFIHNQNIKSLIEYIVTKHLFAVTPNSVTDRPSLEDVATPYVQTLTILRKTYEDDLRQANEQPASQDAKGSGAAFDNSARTGMSEKALEDQRKFREEHEEESYFDSDDDEGLNTSKETRDSVAIEGESDLHRTPRMFSLSEQATLLERPETGDDGSGNNPDSKTTTLPRQLPETGDISGATNADSETTALSPEPPESGDDRGGRNPDSKTTTDSPECPETGDDRGENNRDLDMSTLPPEPLEIGHSDGKKNPDTETMTMSARPPETGDDSVGVSMPASASPTLPPEPAGIG